MLRRWHQGVKAGGRWWLVSVSHLLAMRCYNIGVNPPRVPSSSAPVIILPFIAIYWALGKSTPLLRPKDHHACSQLRGTLR